MGKVKTNSDTSYCTNLGKQEASEADVGTTRENNEKGLYRKL